MFNKFIKSKIRSSKLTFWHYQVTGWIIFELAAVYFDLSDAIGAGDLGARKILDALFVGVFYDSFAFCLTIIMRYIYRKFMRRENTVLSILLYSALVSMVFSVVWNLLDYIPMHVYGEKYTFLFSEILFNNVPVLFGWSILFFVIKYWNKWKDAQERAEKADFLAQNAQLQMLRYQLNPHFLFNSLNSIRALIDEDKNASREMITELSEFFRYSLVSHQYSNVPLKQELQAVKHYIAIERKRFENKLEVIYEIDPSAENYPVLSFILLPLAENAVKFGMATSSMPLKISISAKIKNDQLKIRVCNTGTLMQVSGSGNIPGTGTGLQNIRLRLENAFPGKHYFDLRQDNENVVAEITIEK
jgi:two-component system, LytTR family, sensor kinase